MKTFSIVDPKFFLVGVELEQFSSSKVTIFSRLLVPNVPPLLPLEALVFDFICKGIEVVTIEHGLRTDTGGGTGTAMSCTDVAARLNSLILLGTKYSK